MKRTNSFKLLWQAIRSARQPMWASVQVLIVLTVVLATIFCIAEHRAQPDEYSYWRSDFSADAISCPPSFFNVAGAGKQTIKLGSKSENLIFVIFKLPPMLVGTKFYK